MRLPFPSARVTLPASFQQLAWSNLIAQSAEQISLAAAPLVAVFTLGATASDTGLLQTAQTLPFLLLSIPLGVYADRRSCRGLMAMSEAVRALAMAGVLLLVLSHALTLPLLAVLGFLGATGTVAYSVAAPALVPRDTLPIANGRIELARSAAYSADRRWAGCWSAGSARDGRMAARLRCRRSQPRCWPDYANRRACQPERVTS